MSLNVVKLQSVEGTSDMKSVELKSVEDSLKEYFAKEMMDGENQYKCERCIPASQLWLSSHLGGDLRIQHLFSTSFVGIRVGEA